MNIYITRAGDSLSGVARRFSTDAALLARLNQLDDPSRLTAGLALLVPAEGRSAPQGTAELNVCALPEVRPGALSALLPRASYLCSFAAEIQADGSLSLEDDAALREAAYAASTLPLLAVSNFSRQTGGFSSETAHRLLSDANAQEHFLDSVVESLEAGRYGGAAFDLQYIHPFEKGAYSRLICRASERLHAVGAYLFVFAAPKLAGDEYSPVSGAHDYSAFGQYCDRVIIRFPEPDGWKTPADGGARSLADYAAELIPSGKILLDGSCRGGSCAVGSESRTLPAAAAAALAVSSGAEIEYDDLRAVARFSYKTGSRAGSVWFEELRSAEEKLGIMQRHALAGISLWCVSCPYKPPLELILARISTEKIL